MAKYIDCADFDVALVVRCENCRYAMWVERAKKYYCVKFVACCYLRAISGRSEYGGDGLDG